MCSFLITSLLLLSSTATPSVDPDDDVIFNNYQLTNKGFSITQEGIIAAVKCDDLGVVIPAIYIAHRENVAGVLEAELFAWDKWKNVNKKYNPPWIELAEALLTLEGKQLCSISSEILGYIDQSIREKTYTFYRISICGLLFTLNNACSVAVSSQAFILACDVKTPEIGVLDYLLPLIFAGEHSLEDPDIKRLYTVWREHVNVTNRIVQLSKKSNDFFEPSS